MTETVERLLAGELPPCPGAIRATPRWPGCWPAVAAPSPWELIGGAAVLAELRAVARAQAARHRRRPLGGQGTAASPDRAGGGGCRAGIGLTPETEITVAGTVDVASARGELEVAFLTVRADDPRYAGARPPSCRAGAGRPG